MKTKLDAPRREIRAALQRLEEEPEHVLHVARLALQLFDELADWHACGAHERLLLEAAACLHDIGWSVARDGKGHHKASARLIRKEKWRYFAPQDIQLVALVARYHRKTPPRTRHREFGTLDGASKRVVRILAALLRVADGLDRRHLQLVERVRARWSGREITLEMDAPRSLAMEMAAAKRKGDLLEKLCQRDLVLKWTGRPEVVHWDHRLAAVPDRG